MYAPRFLFGIIFLFFSVLLFVTAQTTPSDGNYEGLACGEVGFTVQANFYCSPEGIYKNLTYNGEACSNSFECYGSCTEGVCQNILDETFSSEDYIKTKSLYSRVESFLTGVECYPGHPFEGNITGNYYCKRNDDRAYLCGAQGVLESKGYIDGVCGYDDGGGSGSGRCDPEWICGAWLDFDPVSGAGCGTRICRDAENCNELAGKPAVYKSCSSGTASPLCGDGTCNGAETQGTCPQDCSVISASQCGNGICEIDESSATCSADCGDGEEPDNTNGVIAFWLLVFILLSAIAFVCYVILHRMKEQKGSSGKPSGAKGSSPPSRPTGPGPAIRTSSRLMPAQRAPSRGSPSRAPPRPLPSKKVPSSPTPKR